MFYFHPDMGRLKSTGNGSTFQWVFKCLMGNGKQKMGVRLSTVFLAYHQVRSLIDIDILRRPFGLVSWSVNFFLTVIFLGLYDPFTGREARLGFKLLR